MRNVTSLARLVLGGYLAVHGAQKLFGAFGGHGIEGTAKGFGHLGLRPARGSSIPAGSAERGGGVLTATGIAEPLGPIAIAGAMTVATVVHRKAGPLSANGGFEVPLDKLAPARLAPARRRPTPPLAGVRLPAAPRGRHVKGSLPKPLTAAVIAGAAALTGISVSK